MDSIRKLYRARKTVVEMLGDRCYKGTEEYGETSFDDFRELYHTNNIDIHLVNDEREVYVKFLTTIKTKPNSVRDMISEIQTTVFKNDVNNLIVVTISKPNNTILKIKNEYKDIEFFWLNRLIVNITHHQYVPLHERVDKKDIPSIMERFNLANIQQLPLIDKNDPVCRYYNYHSGDVCKITRKNKISGISIIYRLVK